MIQLNKIYNEECLEGMKKIPNQFVDAIICDLPYGTTACSWDSIIPFDLLWEQYKRVIKDNCPIVLFGAEPFSTKLRMSNFADYKYDWYWEKNTATGFTFAKHQPMRSVETISVFYKGHAPYYPQGIVPLNTQKKNGTKADSIYRHIEQKTYIQQYTGYPNNVLKFPKESKHGFHPTQKPVALLEYLLKTYSKEGSVILDNCMGSGTTAIACLNTNRNFIGFELDQTYYTKSLKRIEENQTQLVLF